MPFLILKAAEWERKGKERKEGIRQDKERKEKRRKEQEMKSRVDQSTPPRDGHLVWIEPPSLGLLLRALNECVGRLRYSIVEARGGEGWIEVVDLRTGRLEERLVFVRCRGFSWSK